MATTAYELDADGCKFIPATQRPDGTWRKPRRVKDGYIPQEELLKNLKRPTGNIQPIPGMIINVDKKKKKKKSGVDDAADKLAKCEITEPDFSSPSSSSQYSVVIQSDPSKRLKNLRKKLRDIETLEEKIKSGLLKNPDKDQREKISKKADIIKEIELLGTLDS
ncbi:hypothetical protein ACJJTC_009061 [Scirpophaga incertulas]